MRKIKDSPQGRKRNRIKILETTPGYFIMNRYHVFRSFLIFIITLLSMLLIFEAGNALADYRLTVTKTGTGSGTVDKFTFRYRLW